MEHFGSLFEREMSPALESVFTEKIIGVVLAQSQALAIEERKLL